MTWLTVIGVLAVVWIGSALFMTGFLLGRAERIEEVREEKAASVRRNIRAAEQRVRKEIPRWN